MTKDLFGSRPSTLPPDGDKGRTERGAFYTPDPLALAICRTLAAELVEDGHPAPVRILEPGCGGGAFLRAARATWPHCDLTGIDLVPACNGPGRVIEGDLFGHKAPFYDLVVGNPDFAIAEQVVRHCLGHLAPGGYLAFLLRAAFLGSEGRVPLYREHPLRFLQPIAQRPSFTADGKTDPMEYALFVWRKSSARRRGELLQPLVWR